MSRTNSGTCTYSPMSETDSLAFDTHVNQITAGAAGTRIGSVLRLSEGIPTAPGALCYLRASCMRGAPKLPLMCVHQR